MKHYFVVNPQSGKNDKVDVVNELIIPAAKKLGIDYEIYNTTAAGDATRFVREKAEEANGEKVRFYAVGGDGTLYEVVNGAYGHDNVEVAAVPKGSGNDWIRLFGGKDLFLDMESNIEGTPAKVDCIKIGDEIAINQASMGFDAEACSVQGKMKHLPGVAGHLSYVFGGFYCMLTKVKHDFKITIDGKEIQGPFTFAVACNSRWYGSGIKVGAFAVPDDGKLDFVIMRRVTSWPVLFFTLMFHWQQRFDFYKHGYYEYIRGSKMTIEAKKPAEINVDGECHPVNGCTMEVIKDGLTFVIPKNSTYFEDRKNGTISSDIKLGWMHKEPFKTLFTKFAPYNVLCNRKYRK